MTALRLGSMVLLCILSVLSPAYAQGPSGEDSTGLPGDDFSLQGALKMFSKSQSPEEFEKLLNTQENNVNNLDLNGDGNIDYIRVVDRRDKDAHAFVLQVPVSEKESQDVAVIELERTGDSSAVVQIVGDEDIFGHQTIVEPKGEGEEGEDDAGEGGGPHASMGTSSPYPAPFVAVNVWYWPSVRFVYAPAYRVWVSPWAWHRYPLWWRPWRPLAWGVFHPFRARYRAGFAIVRTHRVLRAGRIYRPVRVTSVTVRARHRVAVNRYRVSRTTVIRTPKGHARVKATRPRMGKGRRR